MYSPWLGFCAIFDLRGDQSSLGLPNLFRFEGCGTTAMYPAKGNKQGQWESDSDSARRLLLSQFQKHSGKGSPTAEPHKAPKDPPNEATPTSMSPRTPSIASPRDEAASSSFPARQTAYTSRSPKPNGSTKNQLQTSTSRRSGRQRTEPTNYFEKMHLFVEQDAEVDVDEEAHTAPAPVQPRSESQVPAPAAEHNGSQGDEIWPNLLTFVIYSAPGVQVLRSSYDSLDSLVGLDLARYSRERHSAYFVERPRSAGSTVVHVDFDQAEMEAVLSLLSYCGYQRSLCSEISMTDHIIKIISTHKDPEMLVDGISSICELVRFIPTGGVTDINGWLLEATKSNLYPGKLLHVEQLMNKIVGLQNSHVASPLQSVADGDDSLLSILEHAFALRRRRRPDFQAFVSDARNGYLPSVPSVIRVVDVKDEDSHISCNTERKSSTLNRLLQRRELGCPFNRRTQSHFTSDLKPSKYWKGASNDVISLAWSPDGTGFAAGATAQCDEHNMVYNRNNNLLLGDLTKDSLKELPDHYVDRPCRETSNRNITNDPLFMSITAVQWFGDVLATSSYDKTVKLWDVNNHANAHCFKTLRHDSKVQVMARSNFDEKTLATGANSIGLWNTKDQHYTPLEFPLRQKKKDMELMPTSLAWGTINTTKNFLLAGMSEKGDGITQTGLLAVWHMDEASATPHYLTPNSQNIFDIKWHPSMPYFATGSTLAPSRASSAKSVVRIYEPLGTRMSVMELDCPAIDINDVTFCPVNPNYVTASCTDGITYVWDCRKPSDILLQLKHDGPINQIDENFSREQADVGVRTALWGNSIDQFYSGASDGVFKQWDILQSQDDVLVQDVIHLPEEIMSGEFSGDKTNLLLGDAAGGIHVLSSGPFDTKEDLRMNYEPATGVVQNKEESGVENANNLLRYGELVRHPIYGVGQGPHYKGPFAGWARPEGTPRDQFARTPLKEEYRIQQLDGPPLEDRELDGQARADIEAQIQLARIRNRKRHKQKRKRNVSPSSSAKSSTRPASNREKSEGFVSLYSKDEVSDFFKPRRTGKIKRRSFKREDSESHVITRIEPAIIDLTLDSDTGDASSQNPQTINIPFKANSRIVKEKLEEELEEDFWWPSSGKIDPNIQDTDV